MRLMHFGIRLHHNEIPVRSGFHPVLTKAPKPFMISWRETVPLVGSAAPMTHARR